MKKWLIAGIIMISVFSSALAEVGFKGRPITNNLSMPTGYTLNQGEFLVGIGPVGFGITDNFQASTNVLLWLLQIYNADLKMSFMKTKKSCLGVGIGFDSFNLEVFDEETGFTSISPYVTYSTKVGPKTLLHIGAQYSIISGDSDIEDADAASTSEGTSISAGVEHDISIKTKFLAEAGYDITFEGFRTGLGFLWGWEKFRLKLGLTYSKYGDFSFTWPVIGLWWRFDG